MKTCSETASRLSRVLPRVLSPLLLSALWGVPAHAVTVSEAGDAGQTTATAQVTLGVGPLTNIFGTVGSAADADLFLINITSPAAFSASTVNLGSGAQDTQLFLFTQAGAPVFANDDDAGGLSLLSTLPAGNSLGPLSAGLYYLGIALSGNEPVNSNAQVLFALSGLSTDLRGPAVGLQPARLGAWDGSGLAPFGAYNIQLTGAVAAVVPEPSSLAMFLVGGAFAAAAATRRRRATARVTGVQTK